MLIVLGQVDQVTHVENGLSKDLKSSLIVYLTYNEMSSHGKLRNSSEDP